MFRTVFSQAFGGVVIRAVGTCIGFLVGIILARVLGPEAFGLYALVMASATILATAGSLGWPALATREAANALALEDWPRLRGIVLFSLLITVLVGATVALVALWLARVGTKIYAPLEAASETTIVFGAFLVPILAISLVRAGILRGLRHVVRADLPDLVIRPLTMLALFLAFGIGRLNDSTVNIETVLTYQLIAALVAFAIGFIFLKRALPPFGAAVRPTGWLRSAAPFWLIGQIGLLLNQAPLYLLGSFAPPKELGLFAIAAQFSGIISICLISIEMPLQGRLAEASARKSKAEAEWLAREAGQLGLGVAILFGGALMLFAEHLLEFIGPNYVAAAPVLRVLVLGQIAYALSGPCRIVLSMSGEERAVLRAVIVAFCATVVAALAAIPSLGAFGAAIAGAGGICLLNMILQIVSWRRLRISTSPLLPRRQ